jgi:hypothetical protein
MIQCQIGTKPWFRSDPHFQLVVSQIPDWVSPLLIPELIPIFWISNLTYLNDYELGFF